MLSIPNAERSRCALQNARRSDPAGSLRATVPRRRADGRGPDGSGRGLATGGLKASLGPEAGRAGARPPRRSPNRSEERRVGESVSVRVNLGGCRIIKKKTKKKK